MATGRDNKESERTGTAARGAGETYNQGQKTVQGKQQKGPENKIDKSAGGNEGSKGQNSGGQGGTRDGNSNEERSHAGQVGPNRGSRESNQATSPHKDAASSGQDENAKRFKRPGSQPEQGNKGKAK